MIGFTNPHRFFVSRPVDHEPAQFPSEACPMFGSHIQGAFVKRKQNFVAHVEGPPRS
ncbi:hypothetical protein F443_15344, partial [Phytophthora nicotianae P1569]